MRRPRRAALWSACLAAFAACGSAQSGSSTATAASAKPVITPPAVAGAHHLAYAALGASETYGIGASPIDGGYAYKLRDAMHLGASDFADVGVPGATLADAYQSELTNALVVQPTVTTVFFGVNDIRGLVPLPRFVNDLTDLVATLLRAGSRVLIIGVPELSQLPALRAFPAANLNSLTLEWNAAMAGVASAAGAGFLPLNGFSRELAAHPEEIAPDGLHPSNAGHARLAALILSALRADGYLSA